MRGSARHHMSLTALTAHAVSAASALSRSLLTWGALFACISACIGAWASTPTARAESAPTFTASPDTLNDSDFLRGFAQACESSLSPSQCACVLSSARAAPQPLAIDEPLLLSWVRACALQPAHAPLYAASLDHDAATPQPLPTSAERWWVRDLSAPSKRAHAAASPLPSTERAVRCQPALSTCASAWAEAWVAAATLNLSPWTRAVEVGGDLTLADAPHLQRALITLWTDPAASAPSPPNSARHPAPVPARAAFTRAIPLPLAALSLAWTTPPSPSSPPIALDPTAARALQEQLAYAIASDPTASVVAPSAWSYLLDAHGLALSGALPLGEALHLSRDVHRFAPHIMRSIARDLAVAQRLIWLSWASAPALADSPAWSVIRLRAGLAVSAASPRRALSQWTRAAMWSRVLASSVTQRERE